jgi:hypothetical protein
MLKPRRWVAILAITLPACDRPAPPAGPAEATTVLPTATTTSGTTTAAISTTGTFPDRVPADRPVTLGHVRVSVKRVAVGKVPLRQADGSIAYADQPRLMIAVQLKNVSGKRKSEYQTWVPDLESARSVARLADDRGAELKRVTFGFGNNVKDRTVLDTLAPGKTVTDLLVFEVPDPDAAYLDLDLPGANCGVSGTYRFRIDAKAINRARER